MKKIFAILPLVAVLALSSCSEEFIEKVKPYTMTEDIVFNDPDYIEADLLGCYSIFKASYPTFMGGLGFVVFDSRGDDIVNVSNPVTMQETYEMRVNSVSQENGYIFNYAYYTINYSNLFADKLEKYNCKEILGEELYNQYRAEARFLRAYSYFILCQLYSKPYCVDPDCPAVPLRLEGLESSGHTSCPLSTIGEIYAQILEDLDPDSLPDAPHDAAGVARASKAAAHLLKMRVYMAMNDWDNAITEGKAISGYELAADVTSLYGENDVYSSKEMIFALPSTSQDKPNTQMSCSEYFDIQAQVCWIDMEGGICSQAGYFLPTDQRISSLVVTDGDFYYTAKYVNYGDHQDWVPLMRFAEVELNLAECYVNKGQADLAKASLYNVRSRSIDPADDVIDVTSLSGDNLKTAVYNEKRLEFLCEGIRGIDIARRGENFVKKNTYVDINVAAKDSAWPLPDTEQTYNKAL